MFDIAFVGERAQMFSFETSGLQLIPVVSLCLHVGTHILVPFFVRDMALGIFF